MPVESILLASLTVSPQMSKTGFVAPITPQTRGPTLIPENCEISFVHKEYKKFQVVGENNFVSLQDIV